MINWFKAILLSWSRDKKIMDIKSELIRLSKMKEESEKDIAAQRTALDKAERSRQVREERLRRSLVKAEGINKKFETALEAATEKLKIAEEIQIPTLIQANQTFANTWDALSAECAVKVARTRPTNESYE